MTANQTFAPLAVELVATLLEEFLDGLDPHALALEYKLRFPAQTLFPLPGDFVTAAINFLIRTRFPLLVDFSKEHSLLLYDHRLKESYQREMTHHLSTQFLFEYMLVLTSKLCLKFISHTFKEVFVGRQEEGELYCLLVKCLLGLSMNVNSYRLLQKKFTDEQMYEAFALPTLNMLANDSSEGGCCTKKFVTMTAIQAKLQKRRLKTKQRPSRISLDIYYPGKSLVKFREELDKSLKVKPQVKVVKPKNKYKEVQQLAAQALKAQPNTKLIQHCRSRTQLFHTQQISTSLQMSILMRNLQHSYTRKDIVIRHTSRPSRACIYDCTVSQRQPIEQQKQNRPAAARLSYNPQLAPLQKKTRTYWNKMKEEIKNVNKSFVY